MRWKNLGCRLSVCYNLTFSCYRISQLEIDSFSKLALMVTGPEDSYPSELFVLYISILALMGLVALTHLLTYKWLLWLHVTWATFLPIHSFLYK